MSYDLHIRGIRTVPAAQLRSLLAGMRGMELEGDENGLAFFNGNTGVYFTLNPGDEGLELSINYMRPSFFAREGLRSAIALGKRFGWTILDPQVQGVLALDVEQIKRPLTAWREGNWLAFSGSRQVSPDWAEGYSYINENKAHDTWWHNYWLPRKDRELQALGEDVYVPRIFHCNIDGSVKQFVFVGAGVNAMAIPAVDFVVVQRRGHFGKVGHDLILYREVLAALADNKKFLTPLGDTPVFCSQGKDLAACLKEPGRTFDINCVIREEFLIDDASVFE